MPTARRHLQMIKCSKCIKVEWTDLWCEEGDLGLCRVLDEETKLLSFVDNHHTSFYGALSVGEYLKKLYYGYSERNQ
jgi:hypothetical protein